MVKKFDVFQKTLKCCFFGTIKRSIIGLMEYFVNGFKGEFYSGPSEMDQGLSYTAQAPHGRSYYAAQTFQ